MPADYCFKTLLCVGDVQLALHPKPLQNISAENALALQVQNLPDMMKIGMFSWSSRRRAHYHQVPSNGVEHSKM